jgi:hypothetical protein
MIRFVMLISAAVLAVCLPPLAAVADEVPAFDVRKSCKADVQAYQGVGNVAGCMVDEQNAREVLVSQWTQFGADSRVRCTRMVNDIAGAQSYVELLSCLQDAQAVKSLPKN